MAVMCDWREHVPRIGQEISRVALSPSFPIDVSHWPESCWLICLTYTGVCTGNDGVRMKSWWRRFGENPNTRLTGLLKNCVWRSMYLCRGQGICCVTEYQGSASSIVPQKLSTCFEKGLTLGHGACRLGQMVGQRASKMLLSPPPWAELQTYTPFLIFFLMWMLRIKLCSSCVYSKNFASGAISPTIGFFILWQNISSYQLHERFRSNKDSKIKIRPYRSDSTHVPTPIVMLTSSPNP